MTEHHRIGAPSKATPERIALILDALRGGCTRKAAAGHADIAYKTMAEWIDRYVDFGAAVEKAENEAEARYTSAVLAAVPTNWTAAAWWLERRRPDQYGRRMAIDVSIRDEVTRIAAELGLDEQAVFAEAEMILAERR